MKALQKKSVTWEKTKGFTVPPEKLLTHKLKNHFETLAGFSSTKALARSNLFKEIKNEIEDVIFGIEYGFYNDSGRQQKKFLRAIFFNLSGDIQYRTLYDVLKNHPILSRGDFYFFTNTDIGMTRTGNLNLVRSLALELSYNYVFSPSYLHLLRPSSSVQTQNQFGLVGHAIMSRYPICGLQTLPLDSTFDTMQSKNKRLGMPKSLLLQVEIGDEKLSLLLANLDLHSSSRQRFGQLKKIVHPYTNLIQNTPFLLAGELNTTTYNARNSLSLSLSFLNKALRGYDYIIEEHHSYPERYFDRRLFQFLQKQGLQFSDFNQLGRPTIHCDLEDFLLKGKWKTGVMPFLKNYLLKKGKHQTDPISLKVDWFLGNAQIVVSTDPQAEKPKVLSNLYSGGSVFTKHHPLVLDFELA